MSRTGLLALTTLLLVVAPWSVDADEGLVGDSDLADLSIEQLMDVQVVVGVSRYEQSPRVAPSAVTIITADEIRDYNFRNLAEILGSVSGLYTSYDREYQYLGVRGFLRPGDYTTRVLLLIDGHRVNDAIYSSCTIGNELPIDIDLIDRVEIVKGPSSSVYGSNAVLAVVNIITRRTLDQGPAEFSAALGSQDAMEGRVTLGQRFDNGVRVFASGTLFDRDGERLYFQEFDHPGIGDGFVDNDGEQFESAFASVSFSGFDLTAAYSYRAKARPTGAWETIYDDERNGSEDIRTFVDVAWAQTLGNELDVSVRARYDHYRYNGRSVWDLGESPRIADAVVNRDKSIGEWIGAEVQLSRRVLQHHRVTLGAEYDDKFRQDQANWDEEVYLDSKESSADWGIYVQDELTLGSTVTLDAGLRHDHSGVFGDALSPRAALIYLPSETTTVKLLYGEAFRAPDAYELYYHDGESTQKPNPNLGPERIRTYEIVLEQVLGEHYRGTVSGFHYELEGIITLVTDPVDSLMVFENVEQVNSDGVEVGVQRMASSGWGGRLSYSYQRATDRPTGDVLSNSPRHLAKLNTVVPLVGRRVRMSLGVGYMSARLTTAGTETDPAVVANVSLLASGLLGCIDASVGVYNVLDQKYGDPASEEHSQDAIEQDGRSFRIKLTCGF